MRYVVILFVALCSLGVAEFGTSESDTYPFASVDDMFNGPYDTLSETEKVEGYTLELWKNGDSDSIFGRALRIISPDGTITDIDGGVITWTVQEVVREGKPELVLDNFSGGAHCCTTTTIFTLDTETLTPIFELPFSECAVTIKDVDADGTKELLSCDDTWAYEYCAYVNSPFPTVVWTWNGSAFVIANSDYLEVFQDSIAHATSRFLRQLESDQGSYSPECDALALALPYLYHGDNASAKQALGLVYSNIRADSYQFDSVDAFWEDVLEFANTSELYQAAQANFSDYNYTR